MGFAKNERENIDTKELKALRLLAAKLLGDNDTALSQALRTGGLIEVMNDE